MAWIQDIRKVDNRVDTMSAKQDGKWREDGEAVECNECAGEL